MKLKKLLLLALASSPALGFTAWADTVPAENTPLALKPTKIVEPAYPDQARLKGIEGTVMLEVLVDPAGAVIAAGCKEKNTHPLLLKAAVDAVQKWLFEGTGDVAVVRVPIQFALTRADALDTSRIAAR
jgi:protein TonB